MCLSVTIAQAQAAAIGFDHRPPCVHMSGRFIMRITMIEKLKSAQALLLPCPQQYRQLKRSTTLKRFSRDPFPRANYTHYIGNQNLLSRSLASPDSLFPPKQTPALDTDLQLRGRGQVITQGVSCRILTQRFHRNRLLRSIRPCSSAGAGRQSPRARAVGPSHAVSTETDSRARYGLAAPRSRAGHHPGRGNINSFWQLILICRPTKYF
jgi:hypothetical protein